MPQAQQQDRVNGEEIVKTSVRLPKSTHRQLKQYCLDVEKTEVEAITEAVTEYLRNHVGRKTKQ
jgi:predicted DNA-binding protein